MEGIALNRVEDFRSVSEFVSGIVARVVYSRSFPDQAKPQKGRLNKSPHNINAIANRSSLRLHNISAPGLKFINERVNERHKLDRFAPRLPPQDMLFHALTNF